ncbi:histidine kinase [Coraliomargarita sinensis]|uniref:histidine kinase n=1 Tax=Coraliomargarita sinensis TaxID=2174842 RepID=A0A317ZHJ0_9BACT|nr:GAF domain-containing sensor histidine kinase [Coraliomargarita sinensis]PXA05035.1 histidine kinase [Coraliomargarita sinensis]
MNELERLVELSEFNLDYTALDSELDDLTGLAAQICGARMSLVNLIDRYTQWTVSGYGSDIGQTRREDSACQYTIEKDTPLELKSLREDARFKDKDYVCSGPELNYYYGVPLKTKKGARIGALCVLDKFDLELNDEQTQLLEKVSHMVVRRLESIKRIHLLEEQLNEAVKSKRKVGHDVRGPVGGILGLVDLLKNDFKERGLSEFDEMLTLIENSGQGVLELADSILTKEGRSTTEYTCQILAEKLEQLYAPQALSKKVNLAVEAHDESKSPAHFPPKALLQIGGNLINNAIKFTPEGGSVTVRISMKEDEDAGAEHLIIEVDDNGVGMSDDRIAEIMQGRAESALGTVGERGFGLGLPLVRQLVEKEKGHLVLKSKEGEGCHFTVQMPI